REKLAVRQLRQAFVGATYANKALDFVIVGDQICVADWPVVTIPIATGGFEFIVRQPIGLAAPHYGAPSDLAAADPIKWLVRRSRVGIVNIVDKELAAILVTGVAPGLNGLAFSIHVSLRQRSAVFELVGPGVFAVVFFGVELSPGLRD